HRQYFHEENVESLEHTMSAGGFIRLNRGAATIKIPVRRSRAGLSAPALESIMAERSVSVPPGQPRESAPRASNPHPIWPVLLTLGVVGLIAAAFFAGFLFPHRSPSSESEVVVRPTPALLVAVRDLSRLETGEVHVEKVIDLTDT